MLVVEVDGSYHRLRAHADARRDRKLRRLEYQVIRLPATLVLRNLAQAIGRVMAALGASGFRDGKVG